jgi:hypothetical protein
MLAAVPTIFIPATGREWCRDTRSGDRRGAEEWFVDGHIVHSAGTYSHYLTFITEPGGWRELQYPVYQDEASLHDV